jgi:hypothetical protein
MNREETVSLLKELMTDCESFHTAKAVSLEYKRVSDSWELNTSWIPHPSETDCLNRILVMRNLEMITSNERTAFRSKMKGSD